MKTGLHLDGFGEVALVFRAMSRQAQEAKKRILIRVGLKGQQIAIEKLSGKRNNELQPALTKKYLERKTKQGYSNLTLVRTNTYRQAITFKPFKEKVFIGVLRASLSKDGKPIINIAQLHEFGSVRQNIPPRPLWRPLIIELKEWIKSSKLFEEEMTRVFNVTRKTAKQTFKPKK
jgi:hypothetical protein